MKDIETAGVAIAAIAGGVLLGWLIFGQGKPVTGAYAPIVYPTCAELGY